MLEKKTKRTASPAITAGEFFYIFFTDKLKKLFAYSNALLYLCTQKERNKPLILKEMRKIYNALVKELGYEEGKSIFEWYCKTYNVTIVDEAPASVKREVFGF